MRPFPLLWRIALGKKNRGPVRGRFRLFVWMMDDLIFLSSHLVVVRYMILERWCSRFETLTTIHIYYIPQRRRMEYGIQFRYRFIRIIY